MKLFLLRPKENLLGENPWEPWYDKCFGEVVRAKNEIEARQLADSVFKDEKFSTCEELKNKGNSESIIQDCHYA
jgi:hypothetical protein